MLDEAIIEQIESGQINSRRQLYRKVGRSRRLLQWLNDNKVLVPVSWTKEMFDRELSSRWESNGPLVASDDWELVRLAKRFYGTWNRALFEVVGEVNQRRYSELSDHEMLDIIRQYVRKYRRLPLREEFDGKKRPYWEAYVTRFGLQMFSEIFGLVDLRGVSYYSSHGYGKVFIHNGMVYLSRQEYLIGKYLADLGIEFKKEVPYSDTDRHRFDFYIPSFDVYIEYYGIGTDDYRERVEEKRALYGDRRVIEIFKHDNTIGKLATEIQRL